jgi:hypothetical protein
MNHYGYQIGQGRFRRVKMTFRFSQQMKDIL